MPLPTHGRQPSSVSTPPEAGEGINEEIADDGFITVYPKLIKEAVVMTTPRHPVDIFVGKRIRAQREMRGVTQGWLAEQIGISFQQLQKYETAANRVSPSKLFGIADALGVPPTHFFEGFGKTPTRNDLIETKDELELLTNYRAMPERVQISIRLTVAAIVEGRADD